MQARSKGRRWAAADKAHASFYGGGNDVSGSEAVTVLPGGGCNSTPVGFEPTRGDPIGLAGRRLSRSAKVSAEVAKRTYAASMGAREHTAAALLPGRAAAPASSLSNASVYVQQGQAAAGVELGKWLCSRLEGGDRAGAGELPCCLG